MLDKAPASMTSRPCLSWITAPKWYSPSPEYKLSCFISRVKQVLEGVSKVVCWEAAAHGKTEIMWFQQLLDNIHWCAWGGKPQSVSYVPHLGQLSAKCDAGSKPAMWRAVDTKDYGISIKAGTTPRLMWCKWGLFGAEHDRQKSGPGLPSFTYHC